jgi:hypothetical protein
MKNLFLAFETTNQTLKECALILLYEVTKPYVHSEVFKREFLDNKGVEVLAGWIQNVNAGVRVVVFGILENT